MYPSPFDYVAASSVSEAADALRRHGGEAMILAGGHSLLPLLRERRLTPRLLVDISRTPGLADITVDGETLTIGAAATFADLLDAPAVAAACPLLVDLVAQVGDQQVRNRGTLGGSVAYADPSADAPAALLALDARFALQGPEGTRAVAAADFFRGAYATALRPDELLVSIAIPRQGRAGGSYQKFRNPASGYALVGVAATATLADDGTLDEVRVGVTGAGLRAVRASGVEAVLRGQRPDEATLRAAAVHAAEGVELRSDLYGSQSYRAHLASVLTRRALRRAVDVVTMAGAAREKRERSA